MKIKKNLLSQLFILQLKSVFLILFVLLVSSCGNSETSLQMMSEPVNVSFSDTMHEVMIQSYAPEQETDTIAKKTPSKPVITSWKRASSSPNLSKLMVGDNESLPIKAIQAKVIIDGFRARVILEQYFYNDHARVLEGTFKLRLPNGANPYFFAFGKTVSNQKMPDKVTFFDKNTVQAMGDKPEEIMADRKNTWIEPKEARMVPKVKAAHAYRQTVQRRVDPALMEWSGSGIFSARVFPLAPKTMHRIIIAYDVDLLALGDELEFQLTLPNNVAQRVIDVSVTQASGSKITFLPMDSTNSEITSEKTEFNSVNDMKTHYQRYEQSKISGLNIRISKPRPILLSGADKKTGHYFATRFPIKLENNMTQSNTSRGVFLIDVSLSSNPDQFNIWLKLLQTILDSNRDHMKQFAVSFFNIEQFWWQERFVANTPENVSTMIAYANQLSLEGATDLKAALQEGAKPKWIKAQAQENHDIFLLSDGSITWGENNLHQMSKVLSLGTAKALFAYNNGLSGVDLRVLRHLSRESGGAVFSVLGDAEVKKAATAHRSRPWEIKNIKIEGIDADNDVLVAGRPLNVFHGQMLQLAGRGQVTSDSVKSIKVVLTLQQNEKQKTMTVALSEPIVSSLTSRIYGQIAVGQLESFASATNEMSKAYATHFRITGQTCSLLMLESEEDYLSFNIKPEEDAFVVIKKPVSDKITQVLAEIGDTLGNPKKEFLIWLEQLESMPGLNFKAPGAFKLALSEMPDDAFLVKVKSLKSKLQTWEGIPEPIITRLQTKKLDYDVLMEEAQRRLSQYGASDALRIISSLVENNPGDTVLTRDVAFSAVEWGLKGHAYHLFNRVSKNRPYEPQSYLAMAQVLESLEQFDLALAYYEIGLIGQWESRFGEFRKINAINYIRLLRRITNGTYQSSVADYAKIRLESVMNLYDPGELDILVALTWNTDATDVDLHIIEPTGEECYYKNNKTKIGGQLTQDVTQGYGPEMYTLKDAPAGEYKIKVKYFSSDRNRTSTRTKVSAMVVRNWGRENEQVFHKTVTLREGKSMHDIMTIKK